LRHVISSSTEGDPDSVTAAMDTYWDTYFNGEGTAEWNLRGEALDQAIAAKSPKTAMEIGTYCGYTAVRMGKFIPDGGKLISVEIDPLYAAIATKMVEHAGLRDKVFVEIGSVKSRLSSIKSKHSLSSPIDAVLLDHDVNDYLSDLRLMEGEGLISKGTVVLCDWSLYPGSDQSEAPTEGDAFMSYLASGAGSTARHSLRDKEVFTVSSWEGVV
jgi:catechol O-methyltransferase